MKKLKSLVSSVFIISTTFSFSQDLILPKENISEEFRHSIAQHLLMRQAQYENQDRDEVDLWMGYNPLAVNYLYDPGLFDTFAWVISPDSVPVYASASGSFIHPFIHGFGEMFDPTAEDYELIDGRISAADPYLIDSIGAIFSYRRANHNGIDDTLKVTIGVSNKMTEASNPYYTEFTYEPVDIILDSLKLLVPGYDGSEEDGYHSGLTGYTDEANDVEIHEFRFALTEEHIGNGFKAFPINLVVDPDQVVYSFFEFLPSFEYSEMDTSWSFAGATAEQSANGMVASYYSQTNDDVGYFFDLSRSDDFTYSVPFALFVDTRYGINDDPERNNRLGIFPISGFHIEYYVVASSSVSIQENDEALKSHIYPNPVTENFSVQVLNNESNEMRLSIYDMAGKEIYTSTYKGTSTINLNRTDLKLQSGVYMIDIVADKFHETKRLIIQ